MNHEPPNVPGIPGVPLPEPPGSSAELCLYLIMIQPEMETRWLHIKDFCRLYEIREKRSSERETNPLSQIANVMRNLDQRDNVSSIAKPK